MARLRVRERETVGVSWPSSRRVSGMTVFGLGSKGQVQSQFCSIDVDSRQLSAVRATTKCEAARPKPPHEAARPTPAALPRTGPAARWGRQAAAGRPEGRDAASDKRGARTSTFVISRTHTCFEQLRRSTKHRNKFARRQRAHAFVARSTTPPSSSEISTEPSGATSTSAGRPHTSAPLAHPDTQDETSYGPSPVCASSEIFWTW